MKKFGLPGKWLLMFPSKYLGGLFFFLMAIFLGTTLFEYQYRKSEIEHIMREEAAGDVGGVMHCFTETLAIAQAAIELNFHISFSGIVTFKNALQIKEVARTIPLERILVETDSPYLAPVPHRGKTNEPAWVRHVAEEVARLRGISLEALAKATTANFFGLFRTAKY